MSFRAIAAKLTLALGLLTASQYCHADEDFGAGKESTAQRDARMKWWREAKFGLFIHWNTSCVPGGIYHGKHNCFVGEWIMHDEKISVPEYREYAKQFNPVKFNAEEMVLLAKEAGMKYIVFTAKHCDGLAMYASKVNSWNIVDGTPFKRDVVKELSEACQKHGIRFGLYYAHAMDWNNPGAAVPGDCWDRRQKGDMDDKKSLTTAAGATGLSIDVPSAAPDQDISLVVVRVKGKVEIAGQP